jgi:hypothetical protein
LACTKCPDGTMMKDSEHKMAMGGMAMVLVRATRKAVRLMVAPSAVALSVRWYKP